MLFKVVPIIMLGTSAGINTESLTSLSSVLNPSPSLGLQSTKGIERVVKHIKVSSNAELEHFYVFGDEIGEGSFGKVFAAKEKATNQRWAIKSVLKTLSGVKLVFLQREIQILKMVNHPHIIYLDKVYESPKKIYLVMELCNGELWLLFKDKKSFSESVTKKMIKDLVSAVAYLHKNDIVHRDIKLENILLAKNPKDPTDEYYIKLTDFGLSVIKTGTGIESMLHDFCGTAVYMAPEMISGSYSQQCDVWAIGVIMYLLLFGLYPFYSPNEKELNRKICKEEVEYPQSKISKEALTFMKEALRKDPAFRITSNEMLDSSWLSGSQDMSNANIFEIMKEWKEETLAQKGEESDWMSIAESKTSKVRKEDSIQPTKDDISSVNTVKIRSLRPSKIEPRLPIEHGIDGKKKILNELKGTKR